eukprot:Nk52_evm29s2449 gene=Nk52_evmTU29s2449
MSTNFNEQKKNKGKEVETTTNQQNASELKTKSPQNDKKNKRNSSGSILTGSNAIKINSIYLSTTSARHVVRHKKNSKKKKNNKKTKRKTEEEEGEKDYEEEDYEEEEEEEEDEEEEDLLIRCCCCDSFEGTYDLGRVLTHLANEHRVVIGKIEQVPLPHKYFAYWKERLGLGGGDSEDDLEKRLGKFMYGIGDAKSGDPSEIAAFFLDPEGCAEDGKLRERLHAEHLKKLLDFQQREERSRVDYVRQCLFCREVSRGGNRKHLFDHMIEAHGFNIGLPDNLVYVDEFLDILSGKLDACLCIFCEKEFKSHSVLRIHMRKKKHFKINPQNPIYDRFYLINHLEYGKNWEMIQNEPEEDEEAVEGKKGMGKGEELEEREEEEGEGDEEEEERDFDKKIIDNNNNNSNNGEGPEGDDDDDDDDDDDGGFTLVTNPRRRTTSGSVVRGMMGGLSIGGGGVDGGSCVGAGGLLCDGSTTRSGGGASTVALSTCLDDIPDKEWEEWEEEDAEPEALCLFCASIKYPSACPPDGRMRGGSHRDSASSQHGGVGGAGGMMSGVGHGSSGGGLGVNMYMLPVEDEEDDDDVEDGEEEEEVKEGTEAGHAEGGRAKKMKRGCFATADECFAHMKTAHGFDFFKLQSGKKSDDEKKGGDEGGLGLDFYSCVKLINYIRRCVKELKCIRCEKMFDGSEESDSDTGILVPSRVFLPHI